MKKLLIAGVLAAVAVGSAQAQHRNPDNFYANRAFPAQQYRHYDNGGRVAGAVLGAIVLGAVISAASQPAVVVQQAPVVVEQPAPVYQCQQIYVRDVYGNFVPAGCR